MRFHSWFFAPSWMSLTVYIPPIKFADEDDATTSGHNIDDSEKRIIFINQTQPQKYCNNHISTAKYRWVRRYKWNLCDFFEGFDEERKGLRVRFNKCLKERHHKWNQPLDLFFQRVVLKRCLTVESSMFNSKYLKKGRKLPF